MKKMKCFILAALITTLVNAQSAEGNSNLTISSDGKGVIQKVQLIGADGNNNTIDKPMKEYVFSNAIKNYGMYMLYVDFTDAASKKKSSATVHLFLKAGDTKLNFLGSSGKYSMTGASAVVQKSYDALIAKDEMYFKRVQSFESMQRKYKESGNAKAAAQLKDSVSKAEIARKVNVYESYILQHPNDELSMFALRMYSAINAENPLEVISLYSKLGKELQNTEEMLAIKSDAEDNTRFMKGKKAPEFSQADTSGTTIALSSFQGKYVLIDFWASWCKPCRAANPSLVRVYQKYKDKGFTILSISLDSKKEAWLKAIHDDKLEWQQVSDLKFWHNEIATQYKITFVPQNYLLDTKGVILGKNLGEEDLDQMLDKELSKPR